MRQGCTCLNSSLFRHRLSIEISTAISTRGICLTSRYLSLNAQVMSNHPEEDVMLRIGQKHYCRSHLAAPVVRLK